VVVNEALVKRDFKGRDPIGQRFHISDTTFATIVGVVSDIRNMGPIAEPQAEMYWTYRQGASGSTSFPLLIRTTGDPSSVSAAVIKAIRSIDPTVAVGDVQPMSDVIAKSLGRPRFYFSLLGSFAVVAILLAVAGLYGVLSYTVAQRSPRSQLLRLVALEGFRLVAIGLVLGFLGGAAVTRLMAFMLYGVSPLDFVAWMLSGIVMLVAALLATLVPARRAARADPIVAMQIE
jgi:hypothetical protein